MSLAQMQARKASSIASPLLPANRLWGFHANGLEIRAVVSMVANRGHDVP